MSYTVETAFDRFFDSINLNVDARETSRNRKDAIVHILSKNFAILEAFAIGSIPKFTAIKNDSDLDIMVVLSYGKHIKNKTALQLLQHIRDVLSDHRTNVRKNGQAVTLHYTTWPKVDIVPACRVVNDNGTISYYEIPNINNNSWIKTNPKLHASNIENKAGACGKNFRRIIKFIKYWNLCHGDYLQSYHIEVLALKIFSDINLDETAWYIFQFFQKAKDLLIAPLYYINDYADSYLSISDRQKVIKLFESTINKSSAAWYCTYEKSDHVQAITTWKQVFGKDFPSYG